MRSRLLLLIIIPTLTAVILGGSRIVTSVQSALAYQRVEQLANMSYDVTGLAARLEDERDQTLEYIGEGKAGRAGALVRDTADGAPGNSSWYSRTRASPVHGLRRCAQTPLTSAPATRARSRRTRATSATC